MRDQISAAPHNEDVFRAISSVEQLLLSDDNCDGIINPLLVRGMMDEISNHGTNLSEICFDQENIVTETADLSKPPIRIPVCPVPPSPYSCSCCQTLREIFHVSGSRVLKLGIHGRLGVISHAVMERYDSNASLEDHEFYMFEESIRYVKQFLLHYCNDRKLEGYMMLRDPLSNFYDALCTGLGGDQEEEDNGVTRPKSHIASQRERAGKMSLKDLEKYFHLPISAASKEMNLCPSAIKSICRKEGLKRWPHRKIKSIMSEISKKQQSLDSAPHSDLLQEQIQQLQVKLAKFYQH